MAQDVLDLSGLQTEAINERTTNIDRVSTLQMCTIINNEDKTVADSVTPCLEDIARSIDLLVPRVRAGGRVIYVGAGTSGRLGVLDGSEILPTFAAPPTQFVGLIAGGDAAIRMAQEGAEDSTVAGKDDLVALGLNGELDSVIGIAASGRTPYVLGALEYAKGLGCLTLGVACVSPSEMGRSGNVDIMMAPLPGPEVVTGSTRLKAGTATKLVLNMLSTGTMIRAGKTYGNMMVDLIASNQKLKQRSRNILRKVSRRCSSMVDYELDDLLARCDGRVKLAIVVAEKGLSVEESREQLEMAQGVLARVIATEDDVQVKKPLVNGFKRHRSVLCIDGGGSKCAAVVGYSGGKIGKGVAGPCNLTDGNFEASVEAMVTAAREAFKNISKPIKAVDGINSSIESHLSDDAYFDSIWIASAGMDRPGMRERVQAAVTQSLNLDKLVHMQITNDVDLLAAAMARHPEISSSLVVVAGTGSIAIRYALNNNDITPKRVARAGGWGHLLGDEGAGYAIGRQAIRKTLFSLEEINLCQRKAGLSPLELKILNFFSDTTLGRADDVRNIDLLSNVLVASDDKSAKSRIAGITQTILDSAGSGDAEAVEIIAQQVSDFVENTLSRLLDHQSHGYIDPAQCGLILSGGVMLHSVYQTIFQLALAKRNIRFSYTEAVPSAALVGVEYLLASDAPLPLQNGTS
ncbi:glucokinase regulator family protein, putative [Talaromyces stipitatus ATCC 10500]|uniref:N-acetyl-D-glucosamine kinase n=1 Tax=Talaromyces stipitatus (strain ATCC 10500 / CBS 375.48 / QM 6759 / NRRL 1006) TaxID=441959 RepID=B8M2R9_TALSN|nr:glucokinase regulator family protein, putative [Talaromyces stipitatus ATCC 10500]EED22174.1 glucokinase regulator family protein, putative [Talaromyces stipitatus ATCC 10500]